MRQRSVWTKRLVLSAGICVATISCPFSSSRAGRHRAASCESRVSLVLPWAVGLRDRLEEHAQVLGAEHALSEHDLAARDLEPAVHHSQHVLASPDEEILLRLQATAVQDEAGVHAQLVRPLALL